MRKAILIVLLMIAPNLFSQDNQGQEVRIVSHQVMMGETVRMLSKKYLVPPSEIYRLNKFAVDGITKGMVLKIPVPIREEPVAPSQPLVMETGREVQPEAAVSPERNPETAADNASAPFLDSTMMTHRVVSGETLSGLANQYGVSIDAIKEANPKVAKRGLRADENVKIPTSGGVVPPNENAAFSQSKETSDAGVAATSGETVSHEVQPGETLIGLARKYNVTVDVIKRQNPRVAKKGLQAGQVLKITAE
ncbi:LysM peptidoglycan-binding domain-containing protein [Flavobacterium selenitireducens]|uniref:LysM peptidoglycan-binding domain-containing protein n=1 Tax=Flavobacterium selenitireducens TaxID=2722704 RepID=UPI00168BF54F|nr:LysM peptidoglycan-binding domain-containing protein [Flavobacterium selenitireducens]MBD3583607.1 LysM peptidoglycan-binding domain-containing protein [Flavobacterium selenitireducens]